MGLFARLAGTVSSFFQVGGPGGPGWNDNAGALEGRNSANSAYAIVRGANPVNPNDLVTLGSLTSLPGVANVIRFAIGTGAVQTSVASIPANAIVLRAFIDVTTAYSAGATLELGTAASAALFMATGDVDPQVIDLYDAPQDTTNTTADPLQVTVGGAPAAGAGFACVMYVEPLV